MTSLRRQPPAYRASTTIPRAAEATGADAVGDLLMIVPTYNEAENIRALVGRVEHVRREVSLDLLVVDDSSPDGTGGIVRSLQKDRAWIHLLERPRPSGLGSAYRAGFAWALQRAYAYAGEMDADLSHDPQDIAALHAASLRGADLALGSRYVPGGGSVGWPLQRRLLSRGANLFARLSLRMRTHDVTSGFRVYSRRAIALLVAGTTECDGYGFQVEAVFTLRRAGFTIAEVPIVFTERQFGASKMSRKTALEAARRCLHLAFQRRAPLHAVAEPPVDRPVVDPFIEAPLVDQVVES